MDCRKRIKSLQNELAKRRMDGIVLQYSRDVFYYTGTAQPSYLVVLPDDYRLYVKSGYGFAKSEVLIDLDKVREERKLEIIYGELFSRASYKCLGLELDILPVNRFQGFQAVFKGFEFTDVSPLVLEQRKQKDNEEIARIETACRVIDAGHQAILSCSLVGMTELEVAATVENAHRLAGHDGCFFFRLHDFFMSRGPIASGDNLARFSGVVYSVTGTGMNASVPVGPSHKIIESGEPVMVDIPTSVNGYHADQTRTYIAGKARSELQDFYQILREIEEHILTSIRPGIRCQDIYREAINQAKKLKVADAFLSFGKGAYSKLIGHGIGLEVNEPPILSSYDTSEIGDNFVMAVEMHMFREGIGVVKLEDTLVVGKDQNRILTFSSRELIER